MTEADLPVGLAAPSARYDGGADTARTAGPIGVRMTEDLAS